MSGNTTIVCCPPTQRADALRVLHAGLPVEQKTSLLQTLEALGQDEAEYAGLLVAVASDEVVGAVWVQFTAGQTAIVWPPAIDGPAAADLMRAVAALLDQRRVALAQFLVSDERTVDHDLLAVADFQKLAKLAYFTVDSRLFPTTQPQSQLVFQPNAAAEPKRFGELLLRTYVDSLDCPQLNGVRQTADVLAGYREQGLFSPERWFFIQHEDHDVGALILTEHADTGNWELVYMGLVAEARGAGWGRQILNFALWQTGQGGAERLVLAVDEANPHALNMYQDAGFVAWDYRTVYARLRP